MAPKRAGGILDASWIASFRSLASIKTNPPNCSFVSAKRAIGNRDFAVLDPKRRGGADGLKWASGDKVTAFPDGLVVLQTLHLQGLQFGFGHGLQPLLVIYNQAQILHGSSRTGAIACYNR
jgi:hypothetical protein